MVVPQPLAAQDEERLIHDDNTSELGAYPLEANEIVQAPHPLSIPTANYYLHPWTGKVSGVARREGGISTRSNDRIVFYLQGIDGVFRTRALFVAQRQLNGSYHIYNIYNDNSLRKTHFRKNDVRYVGKLSRHRTHEGHVDFRLVLGRKGEELQASSLIYDAAALKYPVQDGSVDRIVYSVIYDCEEDEYEDANNSQDAGDDRKVNPNGPRCIDTAVAQAWEQEDGLHSNIEDTYKNLSVFQCRRRFTDKRGRASHRDSQPFLQRFGRRAREESKKNLQIADVSTGFVVFQMGRWNDSEFTVDFMPPYNPYEAFGIALAQLETS
ncbi:expressed unknown protein [Seminavis robusta]|uniref:Tubby C-terminal domain-containing protein n=1 Tax=Seminavis robusta TaxID=568900 RepID=A0A9N8H535_9STRA|nr:expressed unknown protein [Seminavis robusta]|eukprot:Sro76_g041790.1 n/a (324) ;mRNA; f:115687-116658